MYQKYVSFLFESFPFFSEHPIISLACIIAVIIIGFIIVDKISKAIIKKRKAKAAAESFRR